ncbi:MAG: ABC transporter permease [Deltaproteobacteria bacterium]|nr:ABC transporter permease [Candidatus Anaeroferrophillus wilburensis]MBN2889376.1 ABC transporter permease [Deltaproteobacteria bacterium]
MKWLRIRELVRKEFIQLFRDRKNRPLLIIVPLLQIILFGYVVSTDVRDIRMGLLDQSRTPESRLMVANLTGNPTFRITHWVASPAALDDLLVHRRVDLTVHIPPDFASRIRRGDTAPVQILADGSASNMTAVRLAHTVAVLEQFNTSMIKELYARHLEYGQVDDRLRPWYNPNLDSQNYYVPGIVAVLVMILTLLLTSMAIIREKESGTMEQLIVTPLQSAELLLGKTIPFILIAQAQMVAVTIFATIWFGIPISGSVPLLFVTTCLFLLSTLGLGLFISTISLSQQQAMMTTFFFILPMFMLSGFVFPIRNMPTIVQWITYLNPLRHMLVIIRGIFLKGVGIAALWPSITGLTVIGLIVIGSAVSRFKKRLD